MVVKEVCPEYGSDRYKKNGDTHHGKQNHHCKACGHQFISADKNRVIAYEKHTIIEHLLHERVSLQGICRVMDVSRTCLLHFMIERFATYLNHLYVQLPPPPSPTDVVVQRPEAEADEMWSFVGEKANKQWSWFTMNAKTHQIMAFHVADRSRASRAQLWANVPEVYQQQAVFHTDLYNAFLL